MQIRKNKTPLSKKQKKLIAIIVAGSLLVLAALYTVLIAPLFEKEQWIYKEEIVQKGVLKVGVSESGPLEFGVTSIDYDLDLDVTDDEEEDEDDEEDEEVVQKYLRIEEVYVKPGQRISVGDILYRFTEDSVTDVRMLLKSAVAEAETEYAQAQSDYKLSSLEAKAEFEIQKLEGSQSHAVYQNSSKQVNSEAATIQAEINQRTANIPTLEKKIEEASENYDEAWAAFKDAAKPSVEETNTVNFMIMQESYLNLQSRYENAKSALEKAQQALEDNAREITALQKELATVTAKSVINKLDVKEVYQESKITGDNAQINYEAKQEALKEELAEAKKDWDEVQEQLDAFETFVGEDGCLYADGNGIVTAVGYEAGDRLRDTGIMVSYAKPEDMTISVDVTQEDIVDLQVGDRVDITFPAYYEDTYQGKIQSIQTTATSSDSNTVSYTVVISVEGDTTLLYGGMTADIVFVTEQKEDVLYISKKAIVKENGRTYVYTKTALGRMELKEVTTGIDNGVHIEIISGLEEGETIYLATRVSSQDAVMQNGEEESSKDTSGQNSTDFQAPEGIELPEGFEMPEGMPEGMPFGGQMPGEGQMPGGGQRPSFGGERSGGGGRQ
ncbi:MAG: HlyD family efflux transporter periplasmic adaptor subunit [Lachnospiraceae bacterium]|nr:HlyD family efflux transporter periplasmic adaptor subunit [Lachnospiraceae bacterium]